MLFASSTFRWERYGASYSRQTDSPDCASCLCWLHFDKLAGHASQTISEEQCWLSTACTDSRASPLLDPPSRKCAACCRSQSRMARKGLRMEGTEHFHWRAT